MDAAQEQAIRILRTWHMVEFFQPYNVPDQSFAGEPQIRLTHQEIHSLKEQTLPWLDANAWQQLNIPNNKRINFVLYLAVFDKSELKRLCQQCFGDETDLSTALEFEERSDMEGDTCFAKLTIDQWGTPDFERMSVSTLPWALGHLIAGSTEKLTLNSFDKRVELLTQALSRFSAKLPFHPTQPQVKTLSANALMALIGDLYQWAQFEPSSQFAITMDWYEVKTAKANNALTDKSHHLSEAQQNPQRDEKVNKAPPTADKDKTADNNQGVLDERSAPILNSFYIEDIQRVINSIADGSCHQAMFDYLQIKQTKHADLYSSSGLKLIIQKLAPQLMPAGRWPGEPKHNMSLMQQFAINTVFDELQEGGLLSVNGPPGTGKTTLLRDVIAQNIVNRAKVLANLTDAKAGLTDSGFPIAALTGFEMVVASSNNLAVENVSKELPLKTSVAQEYADLDHYKPIANQLNAMKNKKGYLPLGDDEQCWGLISAVLGRHKNRAKFIESFFYDYHHPKESKAEAQRPDASNLLNLWRWRQLHQPPNFANAQAKFNELLAQFDQQAVELQQLVTLKEWFANNTRQSWLNSQTQILTALLTQQTDLQQTLEDTEQEVALLEDSVQIQTLKLADVEDRRPRSLSRFVTPPKSTSYELELSAVRSRLIEVKEQLNGLKRIKIDSKKSLRNCQQIINDSQSTLQQINHDYDKKQQELTRLSDKHRDKVLPADCAKASLDISDPQLQRNAFYQDESFNRLRSAIFIASLKLHQAWLGTALDDKAFQQNVFELSHLLKGYEVPQGQAQALWQTLFMLVPVVSTTFASLGRMFNDVKSAQLGWLMIDEAGQAVPQAAVGGIWRAKRVLVVGDPLQIEPVFTTPPRLVESLCDANLGSDSKDWNPQQLSVQQLADRANPYGCELNVMQKQQWVGIPLWVHRRCIEPMFSIANTIAYEGRMIHGLDTQQITAQQHIVLGNNRWHVSQGQCTIKQYKNELGRDTLTLLLQLAHHNHPLGGIYIITPFKAVKGQLLQAIDQAKSQLCRELGLTLKQYYQWRNTHIGTVHTFQGKENTTVILVLGCDLNQSGGAAWAAKKPNLLNVALTRAKQNIFVVGDPEVWQHRSYFSVLAKALKL
ncbi:MAG: hypothetical protein ACI9FJ_001142 [Alteromonadaceae bacterium]|jgi:hypothetical protein